MPPRIKKSKAGKDASTSKQKNTLVHYFSNATSNASASTSNKPTTTLKAQRKDSSKVKSVDLPKAPKKTKTEKENSTVLDDVLDLTMEDEPTAVQINADDVLDLTLVDDDEVMEILATVKGPDMAPKANTLTIRSDENVDSLSELLLLSSPTMPVDLLPTPVMSRASSPEPLPNIKEDEEAEFMNRLMQSLDSGENSSTASASTSILSVSSFSSLPDSAASTAPTSRTSSIQSISSTKSSPEIDVPLEHPMDPTTADVDMTDFLAGSENWDLDDFAMTPVKPKARPPLSNTNDTPKYFATSKGKERELDAVDAVNTDLQKALLQFNKCNDEQADLTNAPCTRCVVDTSEHVYDENLAKWRKTLTVRVQEEGKDKSTALVHLYDDWYFLEVTTGDTINVIGQFTNSPGGERSIALTVASHNLIIIHPDILLTATTLASAPNCARRPLLASLLRDTTSAAGRATPALVYGSLLHIVAQKALVANDWSLPSLNKWIDEAVTGQEGLTMLLSMGEGGNEQVARKDVTERAKGLVGFGNRYMSFSSAQTEPGPESTVSDSRTGPWDQPARLRINSVVDVEEDVWSPRWGMKGKIDATVLATLYESPPLAGAPKSSKMVPSSTTTPYTLPLPLELKTGRASTGMEHRAQTMLYTLLLSERYGVPVKDGLLFYTQKEDGEAVRIPRGWHEIKGLVGVRNGVAGWLWKRTKQGDSKKNKKEKAGPNDDKPREIEDEGAFLPAPVDQEWLCKKCYTLNSCLLFRRTHPDFEDHNGVSKMKPIPTWLEETYTSRTGHITDNRAAFFRKWERLLSLEERDSMKLRTEIWTTSVKSREESGRCLGGMVLADDVKGEGGEDTKTLAHALRRFTHTFRRRESSRNTADGPAVEVVIDEHPSSTKPNFSSLLDGSFNVGDPIVVSAEPDLLAIAQGFVLELTTDRIVVGVDHEVTDAYVRARLAGRGLDLDYSTKAIFRIDKDELSGSMARVRNNLAQLFYVEGDKKLLELVVDLRPPTFDLEVQDDSRFRSNTTTTSSFSLNSSQEAAMRKVLAAEDYALILGMPGTGKTTVIAALIHELVKRGKTVLLSSYTHSAVDTILGKVVGNGDVDFGILRLGNVDKVHPSVRQYTLDARRQARTVEELERQLCSPPVVATTCLSVEHALFTRRTFDYCIVDEASQITLPTCLGPIRFADKFVLVGDHYQLPPLVKNPLARAGGLDVSLFKRLSDAHPSAVVDLCYQYRMNEDIMLLSNKLIYSSRLKTGNAEVAARTLEVPHRNRVMERLHKGIEEITQCGLVSEKTCWIGKLMEESTKAVFVDTDLVPALESRVGNLPQNLGEANMICHLVKSLIEGGVRPSQIGVLSLYRQQVKVLQHLLEEVNIQSGDETERVEVLTTDRSQGRDKDCIIISLVRSNKGSHTGELVRDWRRMNVAFTRARKKLVIFGSRKTLEGEPLLKEFFELMDGKGWIVRPVQGADSVHEAHFKGQSHTSHIQPPNTLPPLMQTVLSSRKRVAEDDSGLVPSTPTRGSRQIPGKMTPRSASMPMLIHSTKSGDVVDHIEDEPENVQGVRPMKRLRVTPEKVGDVLRDLNW
ncbi:hypothetical protein CVT24_006662 [Panaeolus cyanescens]|uniref:DNA replication ATP-dependent helicase/nuclease n=1 Tax=Panaeolus cyanescens TaxID=181874 RepID=A0A409YSG3_9AGAR|nr:hypothetical protein CVT24_006662 [Panaeolus cyanescens]